MNNHAEKIDAYTSDLNSHTKELICIKGKLAVLVAALGYFVDIFDIIMFGIIRVASLKDLGLTQAEILTKGAYILNMQMAGMLLGGFIWGILGDKVGRVKVLYGSIIVYSLATLANAYVTDAESYAIIRFIAGIGLAGEIGAGITLVSELLPKEKRGYGTTIVASTGVFGAVAAALAGEYLDWKTCYILGGFMGLALLLLRVATHESGMFAKFSTDNTVKKGRLRDIFLNSSRCTRYFACVLMGVPMFFNNVILSVFAPEVARAIGIIEPISTAKIFFYGGIAIVLGDICSGLLSQKLKSRKKALNIFMFSLAIAIVYFFTFPPETANQYYIINSIAWFFVGLWAVLLTTASELFGTNIRATVTTSVPNMIRATTIPLTSAFTAIIAVSNAYYASMILAVISLSLGFLGVFLIRETYGKDLDFVER
jgi:putative MFS transporter